MLDKKIGLNDQSYLTEPSPSRYSLFSQQIHAKKEKKGKNTYRLRFLDKLE